MEREVLRSTLAARAVFPYTTECSPCRITWSWSTRCYLVFSCMSSSCRFAWSEHWQQEPFSYTVYPSLSAPLAESSSVGSYSYHIRYVTLSSGVGSYSYHIRYVTLKIYELQTGESVDCSGIGRFTNNSKDLDEAPVWTRAKWKYKIQLISICTSSSKFGRAICKCLIEWSPSSRTPVSLPAADMQSSNYLHYPPFRRQPNPGNLYGDPATCF